MEISGRTFDGGREKNGKAGFQLCSLVTPFLSRAWKNACGSVGSRTSRAITQSFCFLLISNLSISLLSILSHGSLSKRFLLVLPRARIQRSKGKELEHKDHIPARLRLQGKRVPLLILVWLPFSLKFAASIFRSLCPSFCRSRPVSDSPVALSVPAWKSWALYRAATTQDVVCIRKWSRVIRRG